MKRAYRTLSQQAHPDKGGDADAFNALTEAYNVLSNAEKVRLATAVVCLPRARESLFRCTHRPGRS